MKKNSILYKINHNIFLKRLKKFENNPEEQQKALAIFENQNTSNHFLYKKYKNYLEFILRRAKFEADVLQDTTHIDVFTDMRNSCMNDLYFLSKYDIVFKICPDLSHYFELFTSLKTEKEIDFLRRSYKRNKIGMLEIPISDMTIINKNFSEESIDFVCRDNYGIMENQKEDFDKMTGYEFEKFCSNILAKIGFINIKNTPLSSDQGIDILAEKEGVKYAIQCKCYSANVGNRAVQEAFSGCKFYDCHVPVVMTNFYFTESAKKLAEKNNVILWDRDILISYIGKES